MFIDIDKTEKLKSNDVFYHPRAIPLITMLSHKPALKGIV